jgi:hypothetical protein
MPDIKQVNFLPQPSPNSNPLQAMSNYAQNGGGLNLGGSLLMQPGTGPAPKGLTQVAGIPQSAGKWICTALYKSKVISLRQFIRMTNAHALAIFTHGDFVYWYGKNAGKLVRLAERDHFQWDSLSHLVDRMFELSDEKGIESAFQAYMHLCETLYDLFGRDEPSVEPFRREFYRSSSVKKFLGSLRVMMSRLFWQRQVPLFFKLRRVGV